MPRKQRHLEKQLTLVLDRRNQRQENVPSASCCARKNILNYLSIDC